MANSNGVVTFALEMRQERNVSTTAFAKSDERGNAREPIVFEAISLQSVSYTVLYEMSRIARHYCPAGNHCVMTVLPDARSMPMEPF